MAVTRPTDGLGYRQTWQNVTASRAAGTTYTNTTGKPIYVIVVASATNTGVSVTLTIDGVGRSVHNSNNASALIVPVSAVIPNGSTYSIALNSMAISSWHELR